jgi:hypothetical protein
MSGNPTNQAQSVGNFLPNGVSNYSKRLLCTWIRSDSSHTMRLTCAYSRNSSYSSPNSYSFSCFPWASGSVWNLQIASSLPSRSSSVPVSYSWLSLGFVAKEKSGASRRTPRGLACPSFMATTSSSARQIPPHPPTVFLVVP